MVWDPPKKQVNVTRMIIYSFIPILSIYAGWRIQKFWVLFVINFGLSYGVGFAAAILIDFPLSMIAAYAVVIPASVFIVRHYARKYNEKIAASTPPSA